MKNLGLKATWLLPVLLAATGLFITGLSDSAPDAQAESAETAAPAHGEKPPVEATGSSAPRAEAVPASAEPAPESRVSISQSGRVTSKGCLTDEAAVEDMQKLKTELEEKSRALTKRETEMQAKEAAVEEEMKKIEAVRDEIKAANQISIGKNEEKINKLVETFESMAPKAAAQVVNNIEQALAVAALSKVSSPKLAKILSAMDPDDSGSLTEALAGVARASKRSPKGAKHASRDASVDTGRDPSGSAETRKGGENQNGNNNEQQRQPASREPGPATGR